MEGKVKDDYRVKITYKNEKMETVCERDYSLEEYLSVLRLDLLRLIIDVEDMGYAMTNGAPKEMWSKEVLTIFGKIRHKILDKAGEIERLPKNMRINQHEDDSVSVSVADEDKETITSWIAKLFQNSKLENINKEE